VAGAGIALLSLWPGGVTGGQEVLTIPELEGLYRGAVAGYEEAFEVLEVLNSQNDRAYQEFTAARLAGDEAATNEAYEAIIRLGPELRLAVDRVDEKARELREALERLLAAHASFLEELLDREARTTDPDSLRELEPRMRDTSRRIQELRELEDPPVTLEPLATVDAEPRDSPERLRAKADYLERTANQYESLFDFNQERLEAYRRDQTLLRRAGDVLADNSRFGDQALPVRPPGGRTVPPPDQTGTPVGADTTGVVGMPLTLEDRIAALEAVQEEITERIQIILVRARNLRRLAGGEWAW
jgi:hypothetical protein